MGTIQVRRQAVLAAGEVVVEASPVCLLSGAVELPDLGLRTMYLGPFDLVHFQQLANKAVSIPPGLRSRLFGVAVGSPGGGPVGTIDDFEDPLQPLVNPVVIIKPQQWPPPATISVWRRVLPEPAIQPGVTVDLLLREQEIRGKITAAPHHVSYLDPGHQVLAAQARFSATIPATAHGAPVVAGDDREALLGMLISTETEAGISLTNIFPLAAACLAEAE